MMYLSILFILAVATVMIGLYRVKYISKESWNYFMKISGLFLISAIIVIVLAVVLVSLF